MEVIPYDAATVDDQAGNVIPYDTPTDQVPSPSTSVAADQLAPDVVQRPPSSMTPSQMAKAFAAPEDVLQQSYEQKTLNGLKYHPQDDIPDAAQIPGLPWKAHVGMALATTPEGVTNVLKTHVPDIKLGSDSYGNATVIKNNKPYLVEKVGGGMLGLEQTLGRTAVSAPLYTAAALTTGGWMLPAAEFAAGTVGSVLSDYFGSKLGTGETVNVPRAIETGTVGAVLPVLARGISTVDRLSNPSLFNDLPSGTQSFLSKKIDNARMADFNAPANSASDIILDSNKGREYAIATIQKGSPEAEHAVMSSVRDREQARPLRVAHDIDAALGPLTATQRQAERDVAAYRQVQGNQLTPLLQNAPPIDVSPIIASIDAMRPNQVMTVRSNLDYLRRELLEGTTPAVAGTQAQTQVSPILTAQGTPFSTNIPATAGQPANYLVDPQRLENFRRGIDDMINWGVSGPGMPLVPGANRNAQPIINVRRSVSNALKQNVPGYNAIMGNLVDAHAQEFALEQGQNILNKTGGNVVHPEIVNALLADPNTRDAFTVGVQNAMRNTIVNAPNEVSGLIKSTGGRNALNPVRQNLEAVYSPQAIDSLIATANREHGYQEIARELEGVSERAGRMRGKADIESAEAPVLDPAGHLFSQGTGALVSAPVNAMAKKMQGYGTPEYYRGMGQFVTSPTSTMPNYMQGVEAYRRQQNNLPGKLLAPLAGPITGLFAKGGRTGRKSGGKVGMDVKPLVDRLMSLADQAKKATDNNTKPLLNAPDETIVKALRVANQAI